jgi:hypothetical protein
LTADNSAAYPVINAHLVLAQRLPTAPPVRQKKALRP